jgi:hypothetical protein
MPERPEALSPPPSPPVVSLPPAVVRTAIPPEPLPSAGPPGEPPAEFLPAPVEPPPPPEPPSLPFYPAPVPPLPSAAPAEGQNPPWPAFPGRPATPAYGVAPRRAVRTVIAVVAVIVVVAVVAALLWYVETHGPSSSTGANVSGTPLLYSQAIGKAQTAQASMAGAPWTVDSVLGFGLARSYEGEGGLVSGCTVLWETTSTIVVPLTPASASPGELSAWFVASSNLSGDVLLTVVSETSGSVVATNGVEFDGGCTSSFTRAGSVPASPVDSSTVVSSADAIGGSRFLAAYPHSSTLLGLLGPYWTVDYTTCNLLAPSGAGTQFAAVFYAGNGTLVQNEGIASVPC